MTWFLMLHVQPDTCVHTLLCAVLALCNDKLALHGAVATCILHRKAVTNEPGAFRSPREPALGRGARGSVVTCRLFNMSQPAVST